MKNQKKLIPKRQKAPKEIEITAGIALAMRWLFHNI
jgi:hypothetical protein